MADGVRVVLDGELVDLVVAQVRSVEGQRLQLAGCLEIALRGWLADALEPDEALALDRACVRVAAVLGRTATRPEVVKLLVRACGAGVCWEGMCEGRREG